MNGIEDSLRRWAATQLAPRVTFRASGHLVLDDDLVLAWWNERRLRVELVDTADPRIDSIRLRALLEQVQLHDATNAAALLDAHIASFAR